jgi:hypothetical protein
MYLTIWYCSQHRFKRVKARLLKMFKHLNAGEVKIFQSKLKILKNVQKLVKVAKL